MVMKRGSIQPYGASAWQSKAVLKKLRFTRFQTAPGPREPPQGPPLGPPWGPQGGGTGRRPFK